MTNFYTPRSKTLIATGYTEHIIIDTRNGNKYYEFEESHLVKQNIKMRWNTIPKRKVHYTWWVSNDMEKIKIYQQLKTVDYADYKPGKWYISTEDLIKEG